MPEPSPGAQAGFTTAVDLDTEEGRAFLQHRLAFFGRIGLLFSLGFFGLTQLSSFLTAPGSEALPGVGKPGRPLSLGAALAFLVVWLLCRRETVSRRALGLIDAGLVVFIAVIAAVPIVLLGGRSPTHAYTLLLIVTNILVARAVYVPSAPRRTLWIGLVAVGPGVLAASLYRGVRLFWMEAVFWYAITVATSTIASALIFGLRRKVREARQLGQYTLEEKLGEGGMGVVYRARHAMLRRPTAVKLLPPEKAGEHAIRRFEREVQLTAGLSHPNTVSIYDYGRTPDGIFYYAMEYLEGINLDLLVKEFGPQPAARVVHLMRQVAGALGEAHGIGLIHRDVKPANIILCRRGGAADVAKVVDFGLVKDLESARGASVTDMNVIAGTPFYLAPEAITDPDRVDARSDLYALGAVGYFLLTGGHVFEGATLIEVCSHHLRTPVVPPSRRLGRALPPKLEALILACLEKDHARRPQTAQELAGRLPADGDSGDWGDREAQEWWTRHTERLARLRDAAVAGANIRSLPTLSIDLAGRLSS